MSTELSTPKKARVQAVCDFLDTEKRPYSHNAVFRWAGVSKRSGWRILSQARAVDPRTYHSLNPTTDTRGRKKLFSANDIRKMTSTLESHGFDGRTLRWADLPAAAGLDIQASERTIQRAMQGAQFRRCLACHKSYVNPRLAERRCEYARHMLEKYPMPQDWYHVRWSDETHFGWGSEGRIWVLRRPWERDCPDCVVEDKQPPEKDLVRVHAWGAVGHNFKSPLVWYNSGNPNGKMTLQTYRDQIFEPVVGSWLRDGHNFVLEEDNDSGHGTGKSNIVRTWKKEAGLTSFFNYLRLFGKIGTSRN
ncbi:hypothetical protein RB598_008355 [Gaeumannomyces tritici]